MEKLESGGRGRIVLGTVKGDVHDIGKNLVDIILTNNGYEVHNLGIKVPMSEMIAKADEVGADAIGMSGLLVKSTLIMRENLEELNRLDKSAYPVMLGGAALTRTYVEKDLRAMYKGRVFYGKDAFEGLHLLDRLMQIKRSGVDDPSFGTELSGRKLPPRRSAADGRDRPGDSSGALAWRSGTDNELFEPPFLGTRVAKGIPLDDIASYLNETALFRNQWGYRPESGENDADFKERVRAELRARLDEVKAEGLLVPQVVWGYFPVNAEGNDLVVYTDDQRTAELERFSVPAPGQGAPTCASPTSSGRRTREVRDYAAFQIVTMGALASERTAELFAADRYRDYVATHGLSVEMTEALAELWHRRVREEWGFAGEDAADAHGPVPPAAPWWPVFVRLSGLPGSRGQRKGGGAPRGRAHRGHRERGLPAPSRTDDARNHLPSPDGQVLRRLSPPAAGSVHDVAAIDVTDATFQTEVLERSMAVPVVIDLWAPGAGRAARSARFSRGSSTPQTAPSRSSRSTSTRTRGSPRRFQVQSIPAVFVINEGKVVDQFVGALPRARRCRNSSTASRPQPSEADQLVAAGDEASLRRALELEPAHTGAIEALAGLLVDEGQPAGGARPSRADPGDRRDPPHRRQGTPSRSDGGGPRSPDEIADPQSASSSRGCQVTTTPARSSST